jgi:hypothetical protein
VSDPGPAGRQEPGAGVARLSRLRRGRMAARAAQRRLAGQRAQPGADSRAGDADRREREQSGDRGTQRARCLAERAEPERADERPLCRRGVRILRDSGGDGLEYRNWLRVSCLRCHGPPMSRRFTYGGPAVAKSGTEARAPAFTGMRQASGSSSDPRVPCGRADHLDLILLIRLRSPPARGHHVFPITVSRAIRNRLGLFFRFVNARSRFRVTDRTRERLLRRS